MKYTKKTEVLGGHKNKTYKIENNKGNYFMKIKHFDGFNHKLNYSEISKMDYVPNLIEETKEKLVWEFLENKELILEKENLKMMAKILYKLHNSNIKLPNSNHKARLEQYFEEIKNKKGIPDEVYSFYDKAESIIDNFDDTTPLHNDPWMNNFILSKDKIYLIDWEYASLGDKHFDLAFTIDGSYLSKKQEKIFLDAYGEYDTSKLKDAKILVNYLTLVWMHRFEKLPFSDKPIIENLNKK
ncbi:MAG: phosphotransferase [Mycoplasmatales bacterium]|nr:phosphotransferase [Mycoplasmatales bacterium]